MFVISTVHASGEEHAEVVVRGVGAVPVHVRTVRVEVADVHEVAIRVALHSCHPSVSRAKRCQSSCIKMTAALHPKMTGSRMDQGMSFLANQSAGLR